MVVANMATKITTFLIILFKDTENLSATFIS